MRVAIVSNCQGEGLAKCVKAMNGSVTADFFIITGLEDGSVQLADLLRDYDLVFAQKIREFTLRLNEPHIRPELASKVHYFPTFAFRGFHPDMTYVTGARSDGTIETVYTPMVHYHSALVLHGFTRGLSVDEIVASFNDETFSRLGYFDAWALAKAAFRGLEDATSTTTFVQ